MMNQSQPNQNGNLSTGPSRGDLHPAMVKKVQGMFKVLNACKLSRKTEDFVMSLESQFNEKGFLSDRQIETLMDVYERA